jgi:cytochrome c nitrite reductase small subunit
MTDVYASWQRGSHGRVTVCNDCHVPHDNTVAKYGFKAADGTKHSAIFTLGTQPQVLELLATAAPVVQKNCIRCHQQQLEMVRLSGSKEQPCWKCHQNIHGPLRSLSASPPQLRPELPKAGFEFNPIGDPKIEFNK